MGQKLQNMNPNGPPATLHSLQECTMRGSHSTGFFLLLPKPLLVSCIRGAQVLPPHPLRYCTDLTLHKTNIPSSSKVQRWVLCPLESLWWIGHLLLFNINIRRLFVNWDLFHQVILSFTCSIFCRNKNIFMREVHRNLCVTYLIKIVNIHK